MEKSGPKSRRRLFSFTTRGLLVALTLFAVWLAYMVNTARRQRAAVDAIHQVAVGLYSDVEARARMQLTRDAILYDYQVGEGIDPKDARSWVPGALLKVLGRDLFHNVVSLHVHGPVTDDVLAHIGRLRKLKTLNLSEVHRVGDDEFVTDEGLAHLAQLRSLTMLRVQMFRPYGERISERGFQFLARLTNLEHLSITGSITLQDDTLVAIGNLKNLAWLELANAQVTADGLSHLENLAGLQTLGLSGMQVDDDTLTSVARLQNLRSLFLAVLQSDARGLAPLANLKSLESLDLSYTSVTDASVGDLAKLSQLRELGLASPKVSAEGIAALRALPNLTDVWLPGAQGDLTPYVRALPHCTLHFSAASTLGIKLYRGFP